jgi:hypothetical protein
MGHLFARYITDKLPGRNVHVAVRSDKKVRADQLTESRDETKGDQYWSKGARVTPEYPKLVIF